MPDLFRQPVIADYLLMKSKLFARINLDEQEFGLFRKLFDIIDPQLPPPDLLIYLHGPVQQNIRHRGRSYEASIPDEYLEKVQGVYRQFLKSAICPTLIIDSEEARFPERPEHLARLIEWLDQGYDFRTHYLSFT